MATMYQAFLQKNKISMKLLSRPEIVGVGIGYANPERPDCGAAIIIYTRKNIAATEVKQMVTKIMGTSIPVRIIASGQFRTGAASTMKRKLKLVRKINRNPAGAKKKVSQRSQIIFRQRIRPVPAGVSIGYLAAPKHGSVGTAGLIVVTTNGKPYILSNNHVLVRANKFSVGLYQPAPFENGQFKPGDFIGRPFLFVPLRLNQVNFMDAAIAKPVSDNLLNPRYLIGGVRNHPNLIVVPGHLLSPQLGATLVKSGRTTGFVTGIIQAIGVSAKISGYDIGNVENATLQFDNQITISGTNIDRSGDSGGVWLRKSDHFAAALNFAGTSDGSISTSTPIATVMNTFGLRVAAPGGASGFKQGSIKGAAPKGNYSYIQPLSAEERKQIKVISPK
ncbi:hypothetical protein ACFPES_00535 [Paenibacillus sp. GCM10023248]|uniref:hypothetical protein n=1 Tax=unclassified Paenibacillus TaxID=185978 RepID=UPI002378DDC3|nr:hypothetical protein [Paenibacillus sp. MAHUQ-63]MDD9265508.1 hypothetical protein [Paenibacillus sp. MAHUQ-63]